MKKQNKTPWWSLGLGLAALFSATPLWAEGWLGVMTGPPNAVQITEVFKESPADRAGLQRGDWVVELNGKPILSQLDFGRRIVEGKPGSEVALVVWRNGQKLEMRVRLDDQNNHPPINPLAMLEKGPAMAAPGDSGGRRLPALYGRMRPPPPAHTHDYQQRMNSVESLLNALQRISSEKGASPQAEEAARHVAELLQRAREDFNRYRINEGRVNLEKAYAIVTQAVQGLREGETLTHSLHFANKREEFLYELDRFETFKLLKADLIVQAPQKAEDGNVRGLLKQAEESYALAGRQADGGDFANAVRSIEAANDAMVQGLRAMGLDIPG
ncbi:MAG: PDZ domain-containing protein [Magnetococcales bacterium]|nr:PDZ domain-containing protein [Magnetococcales bacterium]